MDIKNEHISSGLRKKRTRTLIQLGGLIEKSGLLKRMNISLGDDLQKDDDIQENVAELFGGLLTLEKIIGTEDHAPALWRESGKKEMGL